MLSKLIQFVKKHQEEVILFIGVILISLFSFLMGFILAKKQENQPLKFEKIKKETSLRIYEDSYYRGRNMRTLS